MTHQLLRVIDPAIYGYTVYRCTCGLDFTHDNQLHAHITEENA